MGKIMKDGQQYGVGGIQKAESITYDNTASGMTATNVQSAVDTLNAGLTNVQGAVNTLNAGLTNVRTLNGMFRYKDRTVSNIAISSDNGYANLGNMYSDWHIPPNAYIISFYVRGWTSSPGTFSLASSSDGRSLYVISTKAGTIEDLSIRVWYVLFG